MALNDPLEKRKSSLYDRAEKYWKWSLWVNVGTQLFVLATIFINCTFFSWTSGFLVFAAPLAVLALREMWSDTTRKADRIRRLLHYSDSLGEDISCTEIACGASYGLGVRPGEPQYTAPYYASKIDAGLKRLLDNTKECAFFTYNLAGKLKNFFFWMAFGIGAVVIIVIYIATLPEVSASMRLTITKAAALFISFLFVGDIALIYKRFRDLEKDAETSFKVLGQMIQRDDLRLSEVFQAVEDYNMAVLQGPPILFKLHLKHKDELNTLYRQSHGIKEG